MQQFITKLRSQHLQELHESRTKSELSIKQIKQKLNQYKHKNSQLEAQVADSNSQILKLKAEMETVAAKYSASETEVLLHLKWILRLKQRNVLMEETVKKQQNWDLELQTLANQLNKTHNDLLQQEKQFAQSQQLLQDSYTLNTDLQQQLKLLQEEVQQQQVTVSAVSQDNTLSADWTEKQSNWILCTFCQIQKNKIQI